MKKNQRRTRYVILGMLANNAPLSGYGIKKITETQCSFFWAESYGQIYPELEKLASEGLIALVNAESPVREKLYEILPSGREELSKWLTFLPETETHRVEVALKFYFGSHGDKKHIEQLVTEYHRIMIERYAKIQKIDESMNSIPGNDYELFWRRKNVELGLAVTRAWADWCEGLERDFKNAGFAATQDSPETQESQESLQPAMNP